MITPLKLQDLTNIVSLNNIKLNDNPANEMGLLVVGQMDDKVFYEADAEVKGFWVDHPPWYYDANEQDMDNYVFISLGNASTTKSWVVNSLEDNYFELYYDGKVLTIHLPAIISITLEQKDALYWFIDDQGNLYWGTRDHKKSNFYYPKGQEMTPSEALNNIHLAVKAAVTLNQKAYSGYHCYLEQYVKCRDRGRLPWRTPTEKY